jgi:small-conductance mechanosensitive channel
MEEVIQNLLDIMRDWWLGALENFPKVLAGILVLIISLYLARLAGVLTDKTLKKRDTDPELTVLLVRIIRWSVIALGIILALQQAGQDTSALLTGLGILGFTIGFALQDVSKNFVAGILLLLLQPFDLGDAIEVAGYSGTVKTVDLRATEILTFDGREVSIPNSEVFTNALVNFSRNTERRISLDVNVSYNSDLEQVHRLAIDTITSLPGVCHPYLRGLIHRVDYLLLGGHQHHKSTRSQDRRGDEHQVLLQCHGHHHTASRKNRNGKIINWLLIIRANSPARANPAHFPAPPAYKPKLPGRTMSVPGQRFTGRESIEGACRLIFLMNPVDVPVNFPGEDNESIRSGSEIIRSSVAEHIAIWVEMQHAGIREAPRDGYPVLHRSAVPPRAPHIVHHKDAPTTQQVVVWKLKELRPNQQVLFPFLHLCRKVHCGGQDAGYSHRLRKHPTRDDAAARDHHHGLKFVLKLHDQVINKSLDLLPTDHLAAQMHRPASKYLNTK